MLEEMKASKVNSDNRPYQVHPQSSEQEARSSQRAYYPADVNETGFTQKLAREHNYNPSSITYSADTRGNKHSLNPPFLGTGYYDK